MKSRRSSLIRILIVTAVLVVLAEGSLISKLTGGRIVIPFRRPACGCALPPVPLRAPVPEPQPGDEHGWRLGDPITYENLTVFPVLASQTANTSGFATLDEALASGDAIVTEQGSYMRRTRDGVDEPVYSGAQVNQLVLINRGKRPLLLLAGEVVSGGKQDRIVGKDRIVPVGAPPLALDVFCVEHGRWTGGSDKFTAANTMVHPSVREKAAVEQDQGKVWAAVRSGTTTTNTRASTGSAGNARADAAAPMVSSEALSTVMAESAPTESYRKIYQSRAVGTSVEAFAAEMERRFKRATQNRKDEHVVGVVVAYGDEVAWSDIFVSSELFRVYWPKLLRSYVVEAVTRPRLRETASLADARDFLRPADGHVREESDPGVYIWRERTDGRRAEIELEALDPKPLTLHWMKVLRAS